MQAILQKIIAFLLSVLAFFGLTDTGEKPDAYTEKGRSVEFCLDSNPTTGYNWEAAIDGDCVILTQDKYVQDPAPGGMGGVGGKQYYTFTAVRTGTANVTFTYARSWETTEADRTVTATITVTGDLMVSVTDYKE